MCIYSCCCLLLKLNALCKCERAHGCSRLLLLQTGLLHTVQLGCMWMAHMRGGCYLLVLNLCARERSLGLWVANTPTPKCRYMCLLYVACSRTGRKPLTVHIHRAGCWAHRMARHVHSLVLLHWWIASALRQLALHTWHRRILCHVHTCSGGVESLAWCTRVSCC